MGESRWALPRIASIWYSLRSCHVLCYNVDSYKIAYACFVGHIPIHLAASDSVCLVWNYEDVLQVLHKHRSVLAYLAGHTHCSAYGQDKKGIHHVVFPGVIEASPDCPAAHATVLLYPDQVVIKAAENSGMSDIVMSTSHCNGTS